MKDVSADAVKEFAEDMWGSGGLHDLTVEVEKQRGYYRITVHQMYEAPGLSFDMLKRLADFLGTTNIDDEDRFHYSGCETCDYGSKAGFTLVARPEAAR